MKLAISWCYLLFLLAFLVKGTGRSDNLSLVSKSTFKGVFIMADNSSNSVAIVAILIIVILAGAIFYFFVNKNGLSTMTNSNAPSKVEVNVPSTDNAAKPS